jgi:PLP dependent protein
MRKMKINSPSTGGTSGVATGLDDVRARIAGAARQAGRSGSDITLVAVSKTFAAPDILPVIAAGQRVFGENRVQEATAKWPDLKADHPDIELHLVGPLQSNKAKEAVALFDVIQSVDRDKIAATLAREMAAQGRTPRLLVQVNTGAEPQKAGVLPDETDAFVSRCRDAYGLHISGLMCIPPIEEAPAPHFALLAKIARQLGLEEISMGMSGDFEIAIGHGATIIRVGTAIFGARAAVAP